MRLASASAALALAAAALVVACGDSENRAAPPASPPSSTTVETRQRLVSFVDETIRVTAAGLEVHDQDDAKKPEECSPPGVTHHWVYTKQVIVRGTRATRLVDDVAAYWRSKGHEVSTSSEPSAFVEFDGFNVNVRTTGPSGIDGMIIGGSSPRLPGPGAP